MQVTIRELEEKDLPQVKIIFSEFVRYHEQRDAILEKIDAAEEAWGSYVFQSQAKDETCRVLVAELGTEIVGYCVGHIVEKPPIYQEKLIGEVSNIALTTPHK